MGLPCGICTSANSERISTGNASIEVVGLADVPAHAAYASGGWESRQGVDEIAEGLTLPGLATVGQRHALDDVRTTGQPRENHRVRREEDSERSVPPDRCAVPEIGGQLGGQLEFAAFEMMLGENPCRTACFVRSTASAW